MSQTIEISPNLSVKHVGLDQVKTSGGRKRSASIIAKTEQTWLKEEERELHQSQSHEQSFSEYEQVQNETGSHHINRYYIGKLVRILGISEEEARSRVNAVHTTYPKRFFQSPTNPLGSNMP